MDTSHVPEHSGNFLAWSDKDEKDVIMASGPCDKEFYFVQKDSDSVWAGIIQGDRAWSKMFATVEEGIQECEDDLMRRRITDVGQTRFSK